MYDAGGPLDKYDRIYGTQARQWDATNESGGDYWFGHCWGWSIASILLPLPQPAKKNGVDFTMDDMKGLYTEAADNDPYVDPTLSVSFIPPGPPTSKAGEDVDDYCDDLYRILRTCIREDGVPVQSDMRAIATPPDNESEVWNQAIYRYASSCARCQGQTTSISSRSTWTCTQTSAHGRRRPITPTTATRNSSTIWSSTLMGRSWQALPDRTGSAPATIRRTICIA